MKLVFNKPLGLGNVYAPDQKCIAPAVIAAGIGAAGSIVGGLLSSSTQSGFTKEQQRLQSRLNREEMNHSMQLQRDYQNMVWNTGPGKQISGMKNAGINPADFNGVSAINATPTTGGTAPSAGMPNMDVVGSALSAARLSADIENVQQNTKLQEQQTRTEAANARLKEWEADPRVLNLRERGMDSQALKNYADADVSKATVIEIGNRCQKLCAEIGLTEAETKQIQVATSKTYTEIQALCQDMKESEQRIVLMRAQALTERARQSELYAAAGEHKASAAEHRSAIVRNHADAKLKGQEIKNKTLEAKAQEISNKMLDFEQQVQAATNDPQTIGSLRGAMQFVDLINPLSYVHLGASTSTVHSR